MFTAIVAVENNRISKFAEFPEKQLATKHVKKFGGFVYDGSYRPDLYIEDGKVAIVSIGPTNYQIIANIQEIERNSLRAIREALISGDNSVLLEIEDKIKTERIKLK